MKTGKGRPGARVLVADGERGRPRGQDRRRRRAAARPGTSRATPNAALSYLVLDGADVGRLGPGRPGQGRAGARAARLPLHRPARLPAGPGGRAPRAWSARSWTASTPTSPGADYRLEVTDSRGRQFVARPVTLSEFGTFHETLPLDDGAPVGTYRVRLYQPGKSDFAGAVRGPGVPAREDRPGLRPAARPSTTAARRSRATLVARYQYGTPAGGPADRGRSCPTAAILAGHDRRRRASTTSSSRPRGSPRSRRCGSSAQLPQDNVAAAAGVMLAVRAFRIDLTHDPRRLPRRRVVPARGHHARRPGRADRPGADASRSSSGSTQAGRVTEREVAREDRRRPTEDRARATVALKVDDEEGGTYVLRVAGHRPVRQPGRRRPAADDLGQEGRDQAPAPGRPPDVQGRRGGRRSTCTAAAGRARRS